MRSGATEVTSVLNRGGVEVRLIRACIVEVVEGPDAGKVARIERPVFRVGTHDTNDLVLSDPTVSRSHLEIRVTPEGYRLQDLSSSNGTFIGTLRATDVVTTDELNVRVGRTRLRLAPLMEQVEVGASERTAFGRVWGRSAAMRELFRDLEAVAASDCSVVVEGETGVGKELVARSLHEQSARRGGPFRVIDCGAMVGPLMESELFGHVRGAFSGAEAARDGLLVEADGGSVFLDEISELSLPLQVKLLGALERRRVTPVGTSRSRLIDVRVVAATHRNLAREVNEGRFRADLFYRLAVVRLRVPPLRERIEDLPLLVSALLGELRERIGPSVPTELSAVVLAQFAAHTWPGNVRELRNAVERALLKLPDAPAASPPAPIDSFAVTRAAARLEFERGYFSELLARPGISFREAARIAGLDRRYFERILRRLDLHPRR